MPRDWGIIRFDGVPSAISRTIDSLVSEGRSDRSSFAPGSAKDLRRKIRGSAAIYATSAMQIDRKSRGENRRRDSSAAIAQSRQDSRIPTRRLPGKRLAATAAAAASVAAAAAFLTRTAFSILGGRRASFLRRVEPRSFIASRRSTELFDRIASETGSRDGWSADTWAIVES